MTAGGHAAGRSAARPADRRPRHAGPARRPRRSSSGWPAWSRTSRWGAQLFTAAGPAAVEMVRRRGGPRLPRPQVPRHPGDGGGAVRRGRRAARRRRSSPCTPRAARPCCGPRRTAAAGGRARPPADPGGDRAHEPRPGGAPAGARACRSRSRGTRSSLAGLAREAGCDGVVASPREAARLRAILGRGRADRDPGHPPGRRPARTIRRATATPAVAVRAGADYLVVGRPITGAADPAAAAAAILAEIARVSEPGRAALVRRLHEIGGVRFGEFVLKSGDHVALLHRPPGGDLAPGGAGRGGPADGGRGRPLPGRPDRGHPVRRAAARRGREPRRAASRSSTRGARRRRTAPGSGSRARSTPASASS